MTAQYTTVIIIKNNIFMKQALLLVNTLDKRWFQAYW